jgi:hypothetical protein
MIKEEENEEYNEVYKEKENISQIGVTPHHIEWTVENENILVEWCDIAQCYKWLNFHSYLKFSVKQAWFTIPVIIMSTITGTISFAQSSFTPTQQFYVQFGVGTINIFLGILSTISQYLKITQLTESHRVSSISWDKFARNIRIELSKPPEERMDAGSFIKLCRHEFDRMMETSPIIQQQIIDEFKKTFEGKENSEQRKLYMELRKPDICDTIISANLYRHKWYIKQENNSEENMNQMVKENILNVAKNMKNMNEKIEDFIKEFNKIYGRNPLKTEIENNFTDKLESNILDKYFESIDNV